MSTQEKKLPAPGLSALYCLGLGLLSAAHLGCGSGGNSQESWGETAETSDKTSDEGTDGESTLSPADEPKTSSAPDEESGSEPKSEGEEACSDQKDTACVAAVPKGWEGPVQPQKSEDAEGLQACPGELLLEAKTYVAQVDADPAECGSCSVELDLGTCAPAQLQLRAVDTDNAGKCAGFDASSKKTAITSECQRLSGDGARAGSLALGVSPGAPQQKEASCKAQASGETSIPKPEIPHHYRICAGQARESLSCEGKSSCFAFDDRDQAPRQAKACVFKEGVHDCPSRNYLERQVLYGQVKDSRGCSSCEAEHVKGELGCEYELGLANRDKNLSCSNRKAITDAELCLTEEAFLGRDAPWSILELERRVTYTGSCKATTPEPKGEVTLAKPITLCCAEF